jgi:hypothetical protein
MSGTDRCQAQMDVTRCDENRRLTSIALTHKYVTHCIEAQKDVSHGTENTKIYPIVLKHTKKSPFVLQHK